MRAQQHQLQWRPAAGCGEAACSGRVTAVAPQHRLASRRGSRRRHEVGAAGRGLTLRLLAMSPQQAGKASTPPNLASTRTDVWEGEASSAGMWDGWPEGPSCSLVSEDSASSISTEEQERLEVFYKKARDTYVAGSPLVTDEFFDKMEARLKDLDSEVVRKWPRCSVLKRRMYSDIRMDSAQLSALGGVWASFLFVGGFVAFAASFTYFMLEDPVLPSTLVAGLTVVGLSVGAVAARSLFSVSQGRVLALKGECPSCTEEVYSFLHPEAKPHTPRDEHGPGPAPPRAAQKVTSSSVLPPPSQLAEHKEGEEAKLHCNCHVCNKPLVFQARVASKGPGGLIKVASGRVYLVPTESDFFPVNQA